jgi:hypothetical protein
MARFTVMGGAPNGDTRQVHFVVEGPELTVFIHDPEAGDGVSVRVPVDDFRAALQATDFALAGVGADDRPAQLRLHLHHDMNIAVGEWSADVSMDQLRDALVRIGLLGDTQPQGIVTATTVRGRDQK